MIRDEIARALCRSFYCASWESTSAFRHDICFEMADAILRIVERAVRDAAWEGANEHATNGRTTMSAIGAIVARVMDGGQ